MAVKKTPNSHLWCGECRKDLFLPSAAENEKRHALQKYGRIRNSYKCPVSDSMHMTSKCQQLGCRQKMRFASKEEAERKKSSKLWQEKMICSVVQCIKCDQWLVVDRRPAPSN